MKRYRRQVELPGMSAQAQERLLGATVAIAGVNAWGMQAAKQLCEVGVGHLIIADSNRGALAEMELHLSWARERGGDTRGTFKQWLFNTAEAESLFQQSDVVVDGLDDWQHKLVASDLCMQLRKPLVHAGGSGFRFQVYTMLPHKSACLRCVLPEVGMDDVPLTAIDPTTLAPVSAMIGALQSLEAIKVAAKVGATQGNELWKFDWLSGEFETVRGLDPRFDCPDCGRNARAS
jgi:molybdopterin/thiamine biosynthesis adenylyltransferase